MTCAPAVQQFRSTYPTGEPREEYGYYTNQAGDTVRHGQYRAFYPNGQLAIGGRYEQGSFDSTWVSYDEGYKGGKRIVAEWVRGKLHGSFQNYGAGNRQDVIMEFFPVPTSAFGDSMMLAHYYRGEFVNGKREGQWVELNLENPNSEVFRVGSSFGRCSAGVKVGPWISVIGGFPDRRQCTTHVYEAGVVVATEICTDSLRRADSTEFQKMREAARRALERLQADSGAGEPPR